MSSASMKRPIIHTYYPNFLPTLVRPLCYHFERGRISRAGAIEALIEDRVKWTATPNCKACAEVLRSYPQIHAIIFSGNPDLIRQSADILNSMRDELKKLGKSDRL